MRVQTLIIFKERKPAWYASITLPHTLSIACVNLLRQAISVRGSRRCPIILDPFCGTGTTLIDAALRMDDAIVIGLDREPLVQSVVRDNLRFFSSDKQQLNDMADFYKGLNVDCEKKRLPIEEVLDQRISLIDEITTRKTKYSQREAFRTAMALIVNELEWARNRFGSHMVARVLNEGFSSAFCKMFQLETCPYNIRILGSGLTA